MCETAHNSGDVLSRATADREAVFEAFEAAGNRGEPPRIDDFLPAGGPDIRSLAELAQTDMEHRLRASEAARAERYLARFPELASNHAAAVELSAFVGRTQITGAGLAHFRGMNQLIILEFSGTGIGDAVQARVGLG